jgi:hypothetical protein
VQSLRGNEYDRRSSATNLNHEQAICHSKTDIRRFEPVGILRRYRAPAAVTPTLNPGSGMYSFIARVVFWVFVAIILFFVAKRFR